MNYAIDVVSSKQIGLFKELDITANNVANQNSAGFKRELLITQELEISKKNNKISYANAATTLIDDSKGEIIQTNRSLDMAILGEGYFKINTPLGPRYTRNGKFSLDENGTLVNSDMMPVASIDGDIISLPIGVELSVNQSGQIIADNQVLGEVGVFSFDSNLSLTPIGGSLYKSNAADQQSLNYTIMNKSYEGSNTSAIREMQKLMEIQSYVGMTANIISINEEIEKNALKYLAEAAK